MVGNSETRSTTNQDNYFYAANFRSRVLAVLDRGLPNHRFSKRHELLMMDSIECMIVVRMRESQMRRRLR